MSEAEKDEFGRQKIEPLRHPRDLFTPEQQAEMDEHLFNMAETTRTSRLRFEETLPNTRLIYVNADAECDEALTQVEMAYCRLADELDVLASIVRSLAASDPMDRMWCKWCGEGQWTLNDPGLHDEVSCLWVRAVRWVEQADNT